jgi:hypothetical protein
MVIDDLLPQLPPLPQPPDPNIVMKSKNGSGGSRGRSKMRECMCQTPTICRELTIQWSRLGEGRYVDYILLPPPPASLSTDGDMTGDITMKEPTTKAGKHGLAFRNVVYRGSGYDTTGVVNKIKGLAKLSKLLI